MDPSIDLLEMTADLVRIPSVSLDEEAITAHVEGRLRAVPWLSTVRVDNNVVARTELGRPHRLLFAGHTDTVPVNAGNDVARIDGDTLWGLGASDMKAGLAVMLALAEAVAEPVHDVTYVFYEAEEVASEHNGLLKLFAQRPDLLGADAAILGEPTDALVEAGCQGTLRAEVRLAGERAHTARPWMGRNAIHRLGHVLDRISTYQGRRPVLAGCEYREALQAVAVEGGVAGNVVPDLAVLRVNHRFAPGRSPEEASDHVREVLGDAVDESAGDSYQVLDSAAGALPGLEHPLLAALVQASGAGPRAKLGWTDVSFFARHGIPAVNFGPGNPLLAHTRDEHVGREPIRAAHATLMGLLTGA